VRFAAENFKQEQEFCAGFIIYIQTKFAVIDSNYRRRFAMRLKSHIALLNRLDVYYTSSPVCRALCDFIFAQIA